MSLKIDGVLESQLTAGKAAIDLKSPETKKDNWIARLPSTLVEHLKENIAQYFYGILATIIVGIVGYIWNGFDVLEKQMAISNTKIEFLQKKFDDSETAYKENVKNELRINRCKNGVILECYNKCNLQEIIKRQNACEPTK